MQPLIEQKLGDLEDVEVIVFPPAGAPPASSMPVDTRRPQMTAGRAALLHVLQGYASLTSNEQMKSLEGASLLEIRKLLYLLQEHGERLKLRYSKGHYGPYAENLNHALQQLEGHYVRGYGDRSAQVLSLEPLQLLPGASTTAAEWLDGHQPATRRHVDDVLDLVRGFASPYGLELLATVHRHARRHKGRSGC